MEAKAEARYIRISPQKARLVVDLIRGQQAGQAITTLRTTNKRIAPTVEKVLKSAIANAQNRSDDVDVDRLFVSEAYVNEGPRMKRVRPAPMGRAYRYQRRMAHIVIRVAEKEAEMGHKRHPYGFRLGFKKPLRAGRFVKQEYAKVPQEDLELKAALPERT